MMMNVCVSVCLALVVPEVPTETRTHTTLPSNKTIS